MTGRGKTALVEHFDIAYELEQTLMERNKQAELAMLRQQVQRLKVFFDSVAPDSGRVGANERTFISDMAKRLQKNNFVPSPAQSNWVKGLAKKYRV